MNKLIHFRRCHLCDHVNIAKEKVVKKCQKCHKHLAPYHYFNEKKFHRCLQKQPTLFLTRSLTQKEKDQGKEYWPLQGLSAYWETNT